MPPQRAERLLYGAAVAALADQDGALYSATAPVSHVIPENYRPPPNTVRLDNDYLMGNRQ